MLLNPALRPTVETISYRNLAAALTVVGCSSLSLANLIDLPSRDQTVLGTYTIADDDVFRSRALLLESASQADEILFAWGSGGIGGAVGAVVKGQAAWIQKQATALGYERVWMVAGKPRHPSRWRQFVGPQKQRVQGNTFEDRLGKVLVAHPIGVDGVNVHPPCT